MTQQLDIAIPLFDGVDELDALGPFEVFRNAERFGASLSCELVASSTETIITASHGVRLLPTAASEARPWHWLVIPGGNWSRPEHPGVRAEVARGALPRLIAGSYLRGVSVASVCTGAMLLSAAGILRGRRATTHQVSTQALAEEGALVIDARVVDDGDLVTAGGVTSGIDLALYLVGRWFGRDLAQKTATLMAYQPQGEVFREGALRPLAAP
jgi:transcriptional regulator GlxA family with amidase domain